MRTRFLFVYPQLNVDLQMYVAPAAVAQWLSVLLSQNDKGLIPVAAAVFMMEAKKESARGLRFWFTLKILRW